MPKPGIVFLTLGNYEKYLAWWVSEPDRGQADAINKGIERSTGEILGWLNSDDILWPRALHRIGYGFATDPSMNITYGFRKVIDADSRILTSNVSWLPDEFVLKHDFLIPQESVYWRRSLTEKVGLLDVGFKFALDYEYWHRLMAAGYRFKLLPYFIGGFRRHPDSKSTTLHEVMVRELRLIAEKYLGQSLTERELQAKLGTQRLRVRRLLKELAHTRLFYSERLAELILRTVSIPLFAAPILFLHRLYRTVRD
jgi:GT2 family glycosyltransferase